MKKLTSDWICGLTIIKSSIQVERFMFVGCQKKIINTKASGNRLTLIVLQKWNSKRKFARISNIFRSIWCLIAVPWLRTRLKIHTIRNIFLLLILNSFIFSYIFNCCHHPSYSMLIHSNTQNILSRMPAHRNEKCSFYHHFQQFFLFKEIFMSCYHAHISSANIACLTM